ncbi:LamG-like jellyroll fold domain-containing protein [Nocardioides pelophilus]|uniref:LamG-like jellyroll fold domain-containing protein n=1 Tax=Nocardioides pelophilus TaxID=2172019 RepID=UPI0016036964|nr:LamG-like jellyroll fold domain-containing protein [Nocardioides pelophilus]
MSTSLSGLPATLGSPAGPSADAGPRRPLLGWCVVIGVVVARAGVAFFGTLVVAALLPVVTPWDGYVVTSGSMEPHISVGDVVLARPMAPDHEVEPGRVFVFEDPGDESGRLLVHRVVDRAPGGRWTTAGDANADFDVAPVPRPAFRARAVVLVPLVGHAVNWWRERRLGPLVAVGVAGAAALGLALTVRPPGTGGRGGARRRRRTASLRRSAPAVPLVALTVALVAAPALGTASSAYTADTRNPGSTWAVGALLQPYNGEVLTDNPYVYYYLDEAGGTAVADSSGNDRTGTATSVAGYRRAGALPNNPGYAMDLAGGGRIVAGGSPLSNPMTYTLELWFRTTSAAGGKLIGFESGTGAGSPSYDRHVTLRGDGRLVYGDWTGSPYRTVESGAGYNDGAWHHLVVTAVPHGGGQLDAVMYVDGVTVASGSTSRVGSYAGWWRVGQGRAGPVGATTGFPGQVDQVAVYRTALSAARVRAHYAAR